MQAAAQRLQPGVMSPWLPLKIHSKLANSVDDISANIESALNRDYIPLNGLLGQSTGAVAVVGSGPSLKTTWRELKAFKGPIMACNAACQFLLAKGITPTYMFCFDADKLALEFFTPHKDITFLIASRCPPKAFDLLAGCKIVCWHAGGDERLEEILHARGKMEPMVVGGSAAIVRAMVLALSLGHTKVHLYGADSSFAEGETHIRQSTTVERRMAVQCNLRTFETAPWMAKQAEDFTALVKQYHGNVGREFIVHGDGLLSHIAMNLGLKTDLEPRLKQAARRWRWKAEALWKNL